MKKSKSVRPKPRSNRGAQDTVVTPERVVAAPASTATPEPTAVQEPARRPHLPKR